MLEQKRLGMAIAKGGVGHREEGEGTRRLQQFPFGLSGASAVPTRPPSPLLPDAWPGPMARIHGHELALSRLLSQDVALDAR
jgi:hypothetical protein